MAGDWRSYCGLVSPLGLAIVMPAALGAVGYQHCYCTVLDLSFQIQLAGVCLPSINLATAPKKPKHAMTQLSWALPHLLHAMATTSPTHAPLFFAKWDIKDGFWHLVIGPDNAWHFCYVLPALDTDPIQLVVPTSLQMGWFKSLAFFCTASETASDIAQWLLNSQALLPKYPLKNMC